MLFGSSMLDLFVSIWIYFFLLFGFESISLMNGSEFIQWNVSNQTIETYFDNGFVNGYLGDKEMSIEFTANWIFYFRYMS